MNTVVLVWCVLCQLAFTSSDRTTLVLRQMHNQLEDKLYELNGWLERIQAVQQRHKVLRKCINQINDDTRITSFELNGVPQFCTTDKDRYFILQQFASAIGMEYSDSDILEIKYFVKKSPSPHSRDGLHYGLNYIVKVKTLAQKEKWIHQFSVHVKDQGYSGQTVFDFPGVCKVYDPCLMDPRRQAFLQRRYSLVNVTMRDHLSPFKMSLMAVVRGKIKPKRHQFRVKVNRSQLIVDRLMPLRVTVRQYIQDFSDVLILDSL